MSHIHGNIDLFDVSSALCFLSHQRGDSRFCHFLHTLYRPTYGKTSVFWIKTETLLQLIYFNVVFKTKHGLVCIAPVGILFINKCLYFVTTCCYNGVIYCSNKHTSTNMLPWTSDNASGGRPLLTWSPSQFCDTTCLTCRMVCTIRKKKHCVHFLEW